MFSAAWFAALGSILLLDLILSGDNAILIALAAVRTIIIADFIMSLDNVLSLAGVANMVPEGKWSLIICGLMISLPIVLCGAQLFLMIMKKLPGLVYVGGGILT